MEWNKCCPLIARWTAESVQFQIRLSSYGDEFSPRLKVSKVTSISYYSDYNKSRYYTLFFVTRVINRMTQYHETVRQNKNVTLKLTSSRSPFDQLQNTFFECVSRSILYFMFRIDSSFQSFHRMCHEKKPIHLLTFFNC